MYGIGRIFLSKYCRVFLSCILVKVRYIQSIVVKVWPDAWHKRQLGFCPTASDHQYGGHEGVPDRCHSLHQDHLQTTAFQNIKYFKEVPRLPVGFPPGLLTLCLWHSGHTPPLKPELSPKNSLFAGFSFLNELFGSSLAFREEVGCVNYSTPPIRFTRKHASWVGI